MNISKLKIVYSGGPVGWVTQGLYGFDPGAMTFVSWCGEGSLIKGLEKDPAG